MEAGVELCMYSIHVGCVRLHTYIHVQIFHCVTNMSAFAAIL